jgi:hypothetical protein
MSVAKLDIPESQPVAATDVEHSEPDEGDQAESRSARAALIARCDPHNCYGRHPASRGAGR